MRQQDRKWLERIRQATDGHVSIYPGERTDFVPRKVAQRLYKAALIGPFIPHNPAHKERYTITNKGRTMLDAGEGET